MNSRKRNEKMTASAFIRSKAADMPIDDLVAAAKRHGISLSRSTVYKVRWLAKNGKLKPANVKQVTPKAIKVVQTLGVRTRMKKKPVDDLEAELGAELTRPLVAALQGVVRATVRLELGRIMAQLGPMPRSSD